MTASRAERRRDADAQPDMPETLGTMGDGNDEVTTPDMARDEAEPELTSEEVRQLLEAELGDLVEDEWIDMCKSFYYKFVF